MKSEYMVPITVTITKKEYEFLKTNCSGMKISELVRRAIDKEYNIPVITKGKICTQQTLKQA